MKNEHLTIEKIYKWLMNRSEFDWYDCSDGGYYLKCYLNKSGDEISCEFCGNTCYETTDELLKVKFGIAQYSTDNFICYFDSPVGHGSTHFAALDELERYLYEIL